MWKTEQKVRDFVEKHGLIREGDLLAAGISGGADSVCLFYLLKSLQRELDFDFVAVHVNHELRGEEAARDEAFVEDLCRQEGVRFYSVHRDVKAMAAREGFTLEEAGRKARYEAFEDILLKEQGTGIVLAHHQDDQAETMIHHLIRGTGLAGLCGLRPLSGNRIRPLLCLERREIEQYLRARGCSWQADSSNQEDEYTRNKIRHHVVSYLCQEINPKAVAHMSQTAEELRETEELLSRLVRQKRQQFVKKGEDGIAWIRERLKEELPLIQRRIFLEEMKQAAGSEKDFSRVHAEAVESLWEKPAGKEICLPKGVVAQRSYEGIVIKKRRAEAAGGERMPEKQGNWGLEPEEQIKELTAGGYLVCYQLISNNFSAIEEKKYTKWLNYDNIKDKLVIRHRKQGDRIGVLVSGGSKKLKDYLIDRKVPREKRDELWVLAEGQEILWVIGDRISEKYKVTESTEKILHIQIKGGDIHE